jgi:hypothetical protein
MSSSHFRCFLLASISSQLFQDQIPSTPDEWNSFLLLQNDSSIQHNRFVRGREMREQQKIYSQKLIFNNYLYDSSLISPFSASLSFSSVLAFDDGGYKIAAEKTEWKKNIIKLVLRQRNWRFVQCWRSSRSWQQKFTKFPSNVAPKHSNSHDLHLNL